MTKKTSALITDQKLRFTYSLALFTLALPLLVAGQSNEPKAGSSVPVVSAKKGGMIFQQRCFMCHNKQPGDDSPAGPPNLYMAFRGNPPLSAKEAEMIVTHGKDQMPAFGAVLSKSDIRSVIAYLRTH